MSCIDCQEKEAGRYINMYSLCGIQYRSNVVSGVGSTIPLHEHNYDHVAFVMQGVFEVETETQDGVKNKFTMASPDMESTLSAGNKTVIPKFCKHKFTLVHARHDSVGEVLCMWGDGWIEKSEEDK